MGKQYLTCSKCGGNLVPVMFTEKEYLKGYPTGRKRSSCSHLTCDTCLRDEPVDGDYLAGPWYF